LLVAVYAAVHPKHREEITENWRSGNIRSGKEESFTQKKGSIYLAIGCFFSYTINVRVPVVSQAFIKETSLKLNY